MSRHALHRRPSFALASSWVAAVAMFAAVAPAALATPEAPPTASRPADRPRIGLVERARIDGQRVLSPRTLGILAAGGALAGLGTRIEEPNRAARLMGQPVMDQGSDFGNVYGHVATMAGGAVGLLAAGRLLGNERLGEAGGDLARGLLYTTALTVPLKMSVGRTRPDGDAFSFPSGHSALAFTAAPILAHHFGPRAGTLAYLAAVSTAMGRIEERKHFVSDVVFGAALGLSVGLAMPDGPKHGAAPSIVLKRSGVGLGVRF